MSLANRLSEVDPYKVDVEVSSDEDGDITNENFSVVSHFTTVLRNS